MLTRRWVLVLIVAGLALTAFGAYVEIALRSEMGTGPHRFLARVFYGPTIGQHRWLSFLCLSLGPAVVALAVVLRRRATADNLARDAERQRQRADRYRARADKAAARHPGHAARFRHRAERCARRSERLVAKAERRRR